MRDRRLRLSWRALLLLGAQDIDRRRLGRHNLALGGRRPTVEHPGGAQDHAAGAHRDEQRVGGARAQVAQGRWRRSLRGPGAFRQLNYAAALLSALSRYFAST